jgi:2-isopropylmalate synthase|eukprot:g2562.t1
MWKKFVSRSLIGQRLVRGPGCGKQRGGAAFSNRCFSSASSDQLFVFDTTLRDGEQSPGATLNVEEKLTIAKQLCLLGVDICEAGFPVSSPGDFEAVNLIAKEVGPMTQNRVSRTPMRICGLARAKEKDIEVCYDAVKSAPLHRIHTFLATSDIHLEHKLFITREECIRRSYDAVKFASKLIRENSPNGTGDVEFSAEDAARTDPDFLVDVFTAAIEAGATTINVPDTVGYSLPREFGDLIKYLRSNVKGAEDVIFSAHCHDDLGLATANTLEAVVNGVRQVELTCNGIGERAGNTCLEEVVMAVKTRPELVPVYTNIDSRRLNVSSKMVSSLTGMTVQPNKAIVGKNAFLHEAGIHQDGVLKHRQSYEIIDPASVGVTTENLILGKHSGRRAYESRLFELGYDNLSEDEVNMLVEKYKMIADEKKVVTDGDLEAVVFDKIYHPLVNWELAGLHVTAGNQVRPTATVTLRDINGEEYTGVSIGTGPVDAVLSAIDEITKIDCSLTDYAIKTVTHGPSSMGNVTVRIAPSDLTAPTLKNPQSSQLKVRQFMGVGTDVDIIIASAKAYLSAISRKDEWDKRRLSRETPERKVREDAEIV